MQTLIIIIMVILAAVTVIIRLFARSRRRAE